jgi:phosphatidylserine/phosphatidylglycerophosphate/cardiolipin synthase-like enzyme
MKPCVEYLTGEDLYKRIVQDLIPSAKDSLLVATATLKSTWVAGPRGRKGRGGAQAESIFMELARMGQRGIEVRVLHSGVPSGPLMEDLKKIGPGLLHLRMCPRTHFKAIIVDGARLYLGSANLTGAGLGAKSARRRNFEIGILTDDPTLIDAAADLFEAIWSGRMCRTCGRKAFCPEPLESPW